MDRLSDSPPKSARFPRKVVIPILTVCALLAGLVGFGFYFLAVNQYKANRLAEKATVLSLVNAFFSTYADVRSKSEQSSLPVPATFRATCPLLPIPQHNTRPEAPAMSRHALAKSSPIRVRRSCRGWV